VLDGKTQPVPLAVNQDKSVVDGSVVNLNTTSEQGSHYETLNRLAIAYDVVFRQFQAFDELSSPDFPLGRKASLRASKDQSRRIEVSFDSQFPLGDLPFVEPRSAATGFPLVHFRSDTDALFGTNGHRPTQAPHELAHALHFSQFSAAERTTIETDYVGWIATDLANGGNGKHAQGKRTSPKVAYMEAAGQFAGRFAEHVRVVVQDNAPRLRPQAMTAQIRQEFLVRELDGTPVINDLIGPPATLDAQERIVPNPAFNGSDDEGSVYGCIFLDFGRRVGLRTAVNAYFRSAADGATTFGGYRSYIQNNRPQALADLTAAQQTWDL
jgi:hypothetical protein